MLLAEFDKKLYLLFIPIATYNHGDVAKAE